MTTTPGNTPIPATLVAGDGIGPEITQAVVTILDHLGKPFAWDPQAGGMAAVTAVGDPLPAHSSTASVARVVDAPTGLNRHRHQ